MQRNKQQDRGSCRTALVVSLVLHVLLLTLLLFLLAGPFPHPRVEDAVAVSIISAQEFRNVVQSDAKATAKPLKSSEVPEAIPRQPTFQPLMKEQDRSADMIEARHFLSTKVLNDPRSAKARKAMGELAPSERIVQLCNIEAMEQIHATNAILQPDFVVAYAMAEMKLGEYSLAAEGAAFRSKRRWYGITFRCTVSPDYQTVVSFAFKVGDAIPEAEWASHQLSVDDGPAD